MRQQISSNPSSRQRIVAQMHEREQVIRDEERKYSGEDGSEEQELTTTMYKQTQSKKH